MVAYNFKRAFVDDIAAGIKRQTIRLPRRRHARPGEAVQLFTGMRTKYCQKIIADPICVGVDEIIIDVRSSSRLIEINGIPLDLTSNEADLYAIGDGFGGQKPPVRPIDFMLAWWRATHGAVLFSGVVIRWGSR